MTRTTYNFCTLVNGETTVGTLNRLFVLVLYLSIGLICYFRLFPRLLPKKAVSGGSMIKNRVWDPVCPPVCGTMAWPTAKLGMCRSRTWIW